MIQNEGFVEANVQNSSYGRCAIGSRSRQLKFQVTLVKDGSYLRELVAQKRQVSPRKRPEIRAMLLSAQLLMLQYPNTSKTDLFENRSRRYIA